MYLEFMQPAVWDIAVIVIIAIGLVLAGRQLARNHAAYKRQQQRGDGNAPRRQD